MPPADTSQPSGRSGSLLEALERLSGALAHDYGNVLTVIGSCTAALLRAADAGQPTPREDLVQLAAAAARAAELTRRLTAFARRRQIRPDALDVNVVVERARAELARLVGEDVELVLDLATDLRPARADAEQLVEALRCLVDNARQAVTPGGQVRISTAARDLPPGDPGWPELAPGPYVLLEVSDDGAGMSPEVRASAFDPLFTTRRSGRGVGLGLSVVEGIAHAAGGAVRIDSAPGRGTRVSLALPRGEATGRPAPATASAPAGGTESILLVEGDARLRGLMLRALAGAGYEVHLAGDAGEALRAADALARPPRLLLAELPPGDEGRLAETLARRWPDLRVLFTSSHGNDRRGPDPGPVLSKPFSPGELLARVRAVLDAPSAGG